jgi:hypothetical protein
MKTTVIIVLCAIGSCLSSEAQINPVFPSKIYKTWISIRGEQNERTGAMFEINDSSITLSNSLNKQDYHQGKFDVSIVDVRNIDIVKIRHKNKIWNGLLVGGITGAVIGGTFGMVGTSASGQIPNLSGYSIAAASIIGAGIGMLIGAAIGSQKTKVRLRGDQQEFNRNKRNLNEYAITYNPEIGGGGSSAFSKLSDKVADADGRFYHTVAVGGQVWMAENLDARHYRDGSEIPDVTKAAFGEGRQYNWLAVSDSRNLCPAGWHVPTITEWTSLFNSLGGEAGAGKILETGFSNKETACQWWSSTEQDSLAAQSVYLNNKTVGIIFVSAVKTSGLSVRCIRDF